MSGRAGATWSGRPQGPQRAPPPPRATTPRGYRPPPRGYRRPAGTAGPPEAGRPLVQGQACPSRSPCASSWVTRPKQVSRRGAACGRPRRGQASRQGVGGSVLARRLLVSAPRALRPDIGPSGRRCSASLTRTRCRTTRDRGGRRARGHLRAACFSFWVACGDSRRRSACSCSRTTSVCRTETRGGRGASQTRAMETGLTKRVSGLGTADRPTPGEGARPSSHGRKRTPAGTSAPRQDEARRRGDQRQDGQLRVLCPVAQRRASRLARRETPPPAQDLPLVFMC